MPLSEDQKKKIKEEETYRTEVKNDLKKKKDGIGCLVLIGIFFAIAIGVSVMSMLGSSGQSGSNTKDSSQTDSKMTEEQKRQAEEQKKQQLQNLSTLFCSERSQPNVRAVDLGDFIAMYEASGETVSLKPANGVYPTSENCQKVVDICMELWNAEDCQKVAERKIWIGMTQDQLILSWGLPNDRNNSTYSFGVHSQWVYGTFGSYVYLEGKDDNSMTVTSWQD